MSRAFRFLFGLLLVYAGGSALLEDEGGLLMWLLLGLGIKLMAGTRQRRESQDDAAVAPRRSERAARPARRQRQAQIPGHAALAVRNAGHDPEAMSLRVSDIGVFAMGHGRETLVHRVQSVRDDVDYIQPWVALRVPTAAAGTLRFEIRDPDDRLHFQRDRTLQLRAGDNLVSPAARMPVHDALLTEGDWQLCVYADGNLLAAHSFFWVEADESPGEPRLRAHLQEDGEMSDELRLAFEESSQEQERSLDELLDFQQG